MSDRGSSTRPSWLSAFIAALALVVSVVALIWSAQATDSLVTWDSDKFEITTAVAIDQMCVSWASYVERLGEQGLTAKEIDARGRWFSNAEAKALNASSPSWITDYCGTAAGILHQRGKPPDGP